MNIFEREIDERQFTLEVNETELLQIHRALLKDKTKASDSVEDYDDVGDDAFYIEDENTDLFNRLQIYLDEHDIS